MLLRMFNNTLVETHTLKLLNFIKSCSFIFQKFKTFKGVRGTFYSTFEPIPIMATVALILMNF